MIELYQENVDWRRWIIHSVTEMIQVLLMLLRYEK